MSITLLELLYDEAVRRLQMCIAARGTFLIEASKTQGVVGTAAGMQAVRAIDIAEGGALRRLDRIKIARRAKLVQLV